MKCEKCGVETEGYRRPGPGHPRIPCCAVCYNPKRWAYCGCGGRKGAKANHCKRCRGVVVLENKIVKLKGATADAQAKLDRLKAALKLPDPPTPPEADPVPAEEGAGSIFA